jgi:hypothetical protein
MSTEGALICLIPLYSVSQMVVGGPLGVREAGPRGPRDYLFCFLPVRNHVKCLCGSQVKEQEVEDDMRLKFSVIQPDMSRLVSSQKIHHFSR